MPAPTPRLSRALLITSVLALGVAFGEAKDPIQITSFGPGQLLRGKVTAITVQGKGLEQLTAVEVSPPDGITVEPPAPAQSDKKKEQRWTLSFSVDAAAAPGKRSIVLVTPRGRSAPRWVTIPDHVPELSDLAIEMVKRSPVIVGFTVIVRDEQADLGEMPMTYCQLVCKNAGPVIYGGGIINRTIDDKSVRVIYAYQDYQARVTEGACVLAVRVADKNGNSSDWLSAPVKF